MEDARVVAPGVARGRAAVHVLGVFDGVGGLPNAGLASATAAKGIVHAVGASESGSGILSQLNSAVSSTGGASTGILALLELQSAGVELVSVGDGGAYTLDQAGLLVGLTPKDQQGPARLTDHLGWPGCKGHVRHLAHCTRLLLCTDGVDGVVDEQELALALRASDGGAALARLFEVIEEAGRPDDATAILAIRRT